MRILGIDPGMAIVGYSLIDYNDDKISLETSGSIQTSKDLKESARLLEIYNDGELLPEDRIEYLFKPYEKGKSISYMLFYNNTQ